jgi:hypothetical protein
MAGIRITTLRPNSRHDFTLYEDPLMSRPPGVARELVYVHEAQGSPPPYSR